MTEPKDPNEENFELIAKSTSPTGESKEQIFNTTSETAAIVNWAATATGAVLPPDFVKVVTESVERCRGFGSGWDFWFDFPDKIGGGGMGFKKPPRWEKKTTETKIYKRKNQEL